MKAETREVCERADDLLSYLYGEANEAQAQSFELHLKQCKSCSTELTSFGQVRNSMVTWRDEILDSFVTWPLAAAPRKKSALAALKGFFDLSPLWMKGAAALATVLFCVLVLLTVREFGKQTPIAPIQRDEAKYNQAQVDEIVSKALAQQVTKTQQQTTEAPRVAQRNQNERKRS